MLLPEEQVWRRRACEPLERDGTSLEGALGSRPRRGLAREGVSSPRARQTPARGSSDPRARRNLTRGGRPTYERGGFVLGGAVPLERSGVPPKGGWADCSTGRASVGLFVRVFRFVFVYFLRV
jgi:hypothetical protein